MWKRSTTSIITAHRCQLVVCLPIDRDNQRARKITDNIPTEEEQTAEDVPTTSRCGGGQRSSSASSSFSDCEQSDALILNYPHTILYIDEFTNQLHISHPALGAPTHICIQYLPFYYAFKDLNNNNIQINCNQESSYALPGYTVCFHCLKSETTTIYYYYFTPPPLTASSLDRPCWPQLLK